mmetsp:Transcript_13404/g.11901  ORF Transcript_13404/g.11901 Transcript_13404/m.11901 type:complete len:127 (+) Transcript_13404:120-500(+)
MNDTGIPKTKQLEEEKLIQTGCFRQKKSLPVNKHEEKRSRSNDEDKPKIKLVLGDRNKRKVKIRIKSRITNIKLKKDKPPRIPRNKLTLNRDKIFYKRSIDGSNEIKSDTDRAYELALENTNLLAN